MRSWRKPLILKRMRPVRGALTTGIITSLVTVAFIVALLAFTQRQTASAVSAALARPASRAMTISGSVQPQQQTQATAYIDRQLRRALGPVPFTLYGVSRRLVGLPISLNVLGSFSVGLAGGLIVAAFSATWP